MGSDDSDAMDKAAAFRMAFGKVARDLGLSPSSMSQASRDMIIKELTVIVDAGETEPVAMATKVLERFHRNQT